MNHEQIIEKVRKLLALARSDNEHEAAAAAGAAERLLQEHRLSEVDLECAAEPTERAQADTEPLEQLGHALATWKSHLAASLCRLHGCHCAVDWTTGAGNKRIRIYGRPSDTASVRYLYAWLTSTIESLAHRHGRGKGRTWANSYRIGAAVGVVQAMDAASTQAREQATSSALVKVDARTEEAKAAMRRSTAPDQKLVKRSAARPQLSAEAFHKGEADGRAIHTGASLPSAGGARMLGTGR
jgi:hypothetical protein